MTIDEALRAARDCGCHAPATECGCWQYDGEGWSIRGEMADGVPDLRVAQPNGRAWVVTREIGCYLQEIDAEDLDAVVVMVRAMIAADTALQAEIQAAMEGQR